MVVPLGPENLAFDQIDSLAFLILAVRVVCFGKIFLDFIGSYFLPDWRGTGSYMAMGQKTSIRSKPTIEKRHVPIL